MSGILILLVGATTVVGLNTLVRAGQDLMEPRNMSIMAVMVVLAIGGMAFSAGEFTMRGIGLADVSGVALIFLLPERKRVL